VVVSGYGPDKVGKNRPHGDILQKPFTPESLTEAVRNCLDAAR
jgi:hypothetical protein